MNFSHSNSKGADLTEESLREAMKALAKESKKAAIHPRTMHIADWQLKEYFGWTDEEIELCHRAGI